MQTLKKVENTPLKNFSEAIWLFRTLSGVYILKINMSTPLEKFVEAFWLITKVYRGVEFEHNHEYTFRKKKFLEAFRLITKVFLGVDSKKSLKYTF